VVAVSLHSARLMIRRAYREVRELT
jgi:hypothetical protein